MLLNNNIQPQFDVYYQGAKLIDYLNKMTEKTVDFFDVYNGFNTTNKISMNLFILTLDWLYILNLVIKSKQVNIEKFFLKNLK